MKIKELRLLSSDDLLKKENEMKKELFTLNYQRKMGNVEKPGRFSLMRREVARILTILKERELEHGSSNPKRK